MPHYPELLEELGGHLGEALTRLGTPADRAAEVAFACVEYVRKEWGGRTLYVPQAENVELGERNLEIHRLWRFEHWPIPKLAKEYDLSEMRIRQILHQVRLARPAHQAWEGITLPVDHPFWDTHMTPNGWRCRCGVSQWSQADLDSAGYGVTPPERMPPEELVTHVNKRTGEVTQIPKGIDPGWAYNPGKAGNAALGKLVGDKLLTSDPMLAARALQISGQAFVEPMRARIESWAEAYHVGALRPTGNQLVIGAFAPETVTSLAARGIQLETSAISISDREFIHALRPPKAARGAAWPESRLVNLPDLLRAPEAIYWDSQDGVLVYVWPTDSKAAKAVIRVNYQVKSEGQKIRTNLVKTTGLVRPEDLANARYVRI